MLIVRKGPTSHLPLHDNDDNDNRRQTPSRSHQQKSLTGFLLRCHVTLCRQERTSAGTCGVHVLATRVFGWAASVAGSSATTLATWMQLTSTTTCTCDAWFRWAASRLRLAYPRRLWRRSAWRRTSPCATRFLVGNVSAG